MRKSAFVLLAAIAGLMLSVFSCNDSLKPDNPSVVETPAAEFSVILHDSEPVVFTDLSGDGKNFRTWSGKWNNEKKGFEMVADAEKGRCKVDADLYDVVPVTPFNQIWFTFESDDAKFTTVNAELGRGGVKIEKSGTGRNVSYKLTYSSDSDPVVTFWTGEISNPSNCRKYEFNVLARETIPMEGIEARLTRMENGETGIYKAVKGGVNTKGIAEEGAYKMEGIWLKWLGSMYPQHGDYELFATQNPHRYYIGDFDPTCVNPDYIEKKIEVEILGTIPRYATPDIGLVYGFDQTREEIRSARWKLNYKEKEGSASDYYYAIWNYTKNPECTWFPRNPYSSFYNAKTGDVYDIDINPADLRGRRIQTWDYTLSGPLYEIDSTYTSSFNGFKVCFHTSGEKPRGYWIAFESRCDSEGIQDNH